MQKYVLMILLWSLTLSVFAQKPTVTWDANDKAKGYFNYKVEAGDNLSKIARKYNTSVKALQKANPQLGKSLSIGTVLHIPSKKSSVAATLPSPKADPRVIDTPNVNKSAKPIIYVVKKGDTYSGIVRAYHIIDKASFDKQNKMSSHTLKVGQKLIVGYETTVAGIPAASSEADSTKAHVEVEPKPAPLEKAPTHYRSDTATLDAIVLEDCGSTAKYVFTTEYPLGAHLVLVNTANNKAVTVTVTAEKPEIDRYNHVGLLMSCAAGRSLDYAPTSKRVKVLVSK